MNINLQRPTASLSHLSNENIMHTTNGSTQNGLQKHKLASNTLSLIVYYYISVLTTTKPYLIPPHSMWLQVCAMPKTLFDNSLFGSSRMLGYFCSLTRQNIFISFGTTRDKRKLAQGISIHFCPNYHIFNPLLTTLVHKFKCKQLRSLAPLFSWYSSSNPV